MNYSKNRVGNAPVSIGTSGRLCALHISEIKTENVTVNAASN